MIQVSIGSRSRSPFRPLSLRMMSRADLMRLPSCWAVVRGWFGAFALVHVHVPHLLLAGGPKRSHKGFRTIHELRGSRRSGSPLDASTTAGQVPRLLWRGPLNDRVGARRPSRVDCRARSLRCAATRSTPALSSRASADFQLDTIRRYMDSGHRPHFPVSTAHASWKIGHDRPAFISVRMRYVAVDPWSRWNKHRDWAVTGKHACPGTPRGLMFASPSKPSLPCRRRSAESRAHVPRPHDAVDQPRASGSMSFETNPMPLTPQQ